MEPPTDLAQSAEGAHRLDIEDEQHDMSLLIEDQGEGFVARVARGIKEEER